MSPLLRRLAVASVLPLCAVVVLTLLTADHRLPAPDTRPAAIVALGDSTIAGEGAGDYLPGTRGEDGNFCHRSRHSLVNRVELGAPAARFNLACSGAPAAAVGFDGEDGWPEDSQARRLGELAREYRVPTVLLAVGANDDPAFADVVLRCAQAWVLQQWQPACSESLAEEWPQRLERMAQHVAAAVEDVRTAMRTAGYQDRHYSLVLMSYAVPVSERVVPGLQDLSGCPFRTADIRWLREDAIPALSTTLRTVAQGAQARFVDLTRAAEGHEACTSTDGPDAEWMTRLVVDFDALRSDDAALHAVQESFHPNANGHAQIAGCLSEFLATSAREASCRVGDDGRLHPAAMPRGAEG